MAFELKTVVPWGRNFDEYKRMFNLSQNDLSKKIISVGDGPASFNYEMKLLGYDITSLDPIYQFSKDQIITRINETRDEIIDQTKKNLNNFVWNDIKNVEELESIRMKAMQHFVKDFNNGKTEKRYIYHELPNKTSFSNKEFDIALSSHFLILYSKLGIEFHINSITELLRIAKEVRIFPLVNLNAQKSEVLDGIIDYFSSRDISIEDTSYEFQKGANKMLRIKN